MNNGETRRIWVGLLDNSGTVEVCAWNPLLTDATPSAMPNTLSLKGFTPNADVTTTAEGSGTATSAHVLYGTNARTNVPFILLGFIEISEATAGVWATAPSVVQTYRDGYRKTGDLVQSCMNQTGEHATTTTVTPADDTIPQNTEGAEFMTQAITPTSSVNILTITHIGAYSLTTERYTCALHQDSTADAIAAIMNQSGSGNECSVTMFTYRMLAGTTSATTFRIRSGPATAVTLNFNGFSAARKLGGVSASSLAVEEIYV